MELSNLAVKDEKEWREKKGRRRLSIGRERDTHDVGGRRLPQHCPRVGMEPCLASKILQVSYVGIVCERDKIKPFKVSRATETG